MLIMTPGPIAVDERVFRALCRPSVVHYAPDFFPLLDETLDLMRPLFGTEEADTLVIPGSGRVGMESALISVVEPGEPVLCLVNGTFGDWWAQIARRAGCEVDVLEGDWSRGIDPSAVEEKLRSKRYKALTVVHSETSTGVVNPVGEIARLCRKHDVLCLLDAMSSYACMEVKMDEWGVDIALSASQKGVGAIMGLALVAVGPRAWEAMEKRRTVCPSFSFDLKRWREIGFFERTIPRRYAVLPSPHLVLALREALLLIHEEGLEIRFRRHKVYARAVRRGVKAMGLDLFPEEGHETDTLTAVKMPKEGLDSEVVRIMREKFGVLISGGLYQMKGKMSASPTWAFKPPANFSSPP